MNLNPQFFTLLFWSVFKLARTYHAKPGKKKGRRWGTFIIILLAGTIGAIPAFAQANQLAGDQDSDKLNDLFAVGVGVQHGFIFPHSKDVQNTKGARPTGMEGLVSWQKNDRATWNLCHCFPRQGLLVAYYSFDNAVLGKGTMAAYFLEPTYKITDKVFFSVKGAAGFAYLTNPFDSKINPTNQSYSTAISAYLVFGVAAWVRINNRWWISPSVNYQHISNGGMKKPNKGINWPTAGVSVVYQPNQRPYTTGVHTREKFWKEYSPRWDIVAFGNLRRGFNERGSRIRSPLYGLSVQGARQVGHINTITLGAEVYHDEELQNELRKASIKASAAKAGIMVGHEFILGKFLFSQRLGYYVFDQTPYYDQLFHRWGLSYRINKSWGLGFNLLAHRQVAEFVDLRITYSFQKKYN